MIRLATLALFVALVASAPTSNESSEEKDEKLTITSQFYAKELKVHTAEHEIISLLYPINGLNFADDDDDDDDNDDTGSEDKVLFFVEADLTNGVEYKGLSVFKVANVTKILPTGTSVASDADEIKTAYFGATDGLYRYNAAENKAEKYGPITDSIIDIAKANGTDLIYILTDKNELFKVTDEGKEKQKVDSVVGAKQIVLDYSNNLYYYGEEKQPHVVTSEGVKKIEGLPSNPGYIKLLRPAFVIEDGVPIVLDDDLYLIYANGSSEITDIKVLDKPSAYATDATLIQYYAHNKSIYEYNIMELIFGDLLTTLKTFMEAKKDEITSLATRSRSGFSP